MRAPSVLYKETRERLTELVSDLDEAKAAVMVPSTPEWSVKDVVAHLSGLVEDWLDRRLDGYGSEPWTDRQVEERRHLGLGEVLDEWTSSAPRLEAIMDEPELQGFPDFMPYLATADVAIHEHDIRGVLDRPGARDSGAVELGMRTYLTGVRQRHEKTDLGPLLVVESDGREWAVGRGDPVATVTAPRYELFRAMAGRRSRDQVLRFRWTGDPEPFVDLFIAPGFAWAEKDLDH